MTECTHEISRTAYPALERCELCRTLDEAESLLNLVVTLKDKLAVAEKALKNPRMDFVEYRALLNLIMCSDPWPSNKDDEVIIRRWANIRAKYLGCRDWVDAYHKYIGPTLRGEDKG